MTNPVPLQFTEDDATEMLQSNYWAKFSEARELLMEAASRGYAHAAAQSAADNAALRKQLNAAKTIIAGQDERSIHLARKHGELMQRASDVAGERAANAILTDENAVLREQLLAQDAHEASLAEAQAYLMARVKVLEEALRGMLAGEDVACTLEAYAAASNAARAALEAK